MCKAYTVECYQTREQDNASVGDARQRQYLWLYILIHANTSFLLHVSVHFYLLLPFHLTHLLQLLVPHCSLLAPPPSNILLTHNCGTLSPVLPINPHHRHLGPLSRLSLNVHSKLSKSGPFQQRVPEHSLEAMRPTAEYAFYCTDRLVVCITHPPSKYHWLENGRRHGSQSKGHVRISSTEIHMHAEYIIFMLSRA